MQESRRPLSLLAQLRVVLMSYVTRPGLQWAALATGAGMLIYCAAILIAHGNNHTSFHSDPLMSMVAIVGSLTALCGAVGFVVIVLLHARQQLAGWPARMLPHTRAANLIIAAPMLPLFAAVAAYVAREGYGHGFGLFIVYFGLLILTAYAFLRPWLLIVLVIGGFFAVRYAALDSQLNQLTIDRERIDESYRGVQTEVDPVELALSDAHDKIPASEYNVLAEEHLTLVATRRGMMQDYYQLMQTQRIAMFLGELVVFIGLGLVTRPARQFNPSIIAFLRRNDATRPRRSEAIHLREHSFITSRLARSLHRRMATHDWRAGAVAALAMGVLSIWFNLQFRVDIAVPMLTMMLAFLPGALVAVGWRERWPTFEFESLYPVSRRELVTDMAVGLVLDVAEFWIASALAVTIVCAALRTAVLHDPRFWVALLAGGMMQFLWLGGIFFVGQRRQLSSYVAGLTPGVVAMFLPLQALWQSGRSMPASLALLMASIEMGAGLAIFLLTWAVVQRGSRPAAEQLSGHGQAA